MTTPRPLGNSGISVTPIIFGAWAIGGWMWGGTEETESIHAIHASIDAGVNVIDTAAIYGFGKSEELVGKAIKKYSRDKVVIATKCGMRWNSEEGTDPWPQKDNDGKDVIVRKNSKPNSITYECEQSLQRLGTDYIDLYQIHWPDTSTPVEDSLDAMHKLLKAGKIRAIGVSNYDVPRLEAAKKLVPLASNQPPYSLISRQIEKDVLPWCKKNSVGIICYSPMERGLLTGKVGPDRTFIEGDHRAKNRFFTVENRHRVQKSLEAIQPIADAHNATLAQVVINWTCQVPGITAALVGARNAEQAKANAAALSFTLSEGELKQIRAAFDQTSAEMLATK